MGTENETLDEPFDIFGQIGRLVGRKLDDRATKISLGNEKEILEALIDLRATKVSLASAESVLEALIGLRASKTSLFNAESSLGGLIDLRATKVSLNAEKESLESLIDLRATEISLNAEKEALQSLVNLRATEVSLATDKSYLENLINSLSNDTQDLEDRLDEITEPEQGNGTQGIIKDSFQANGADSWYLIGSEKSIASEDATDSSAGVLLVKASANDEDSTDLVDATAQGSYNYPANPSNAPAVAWNRRGQILRGEYEQTFVITLNNGVFIDAQSSFTLELAKRNTYTFDWSADLNSPVTIEEDGASYTTGVTVDNAIGTTVFSIPQTASDNLSFVINGISTPLEIKKAPFHSFSDTLDRINYNLLDVLSSKKTTKTNKVLVLTDTTANDYQFWTNTPYIFEYWKAIGDNKGIDVEFVGINGDCPMSAVSSFHSYSYRKYQTDSGWALMSDFELEYGGIPSIQSFFTDTSKTINDWTTYLNQYDSVIYYAFNKYAYFPKVFIDALAEFREQGGGLYFNSGWRYYVRAVNPVLAPYDVTYYGGPVHGRSGVTRQPPRDEVTGLIDYSNVQSHLKISTLQSAEYGYQDLWSDINPNEYVFAGSNQPYILADITSDLAKDILDQNKSILDLVDTPESFDISKRNLKVNAGGDSLEFVNDNFVVDGEFRGMMGNLLFHRNNLLVTQGEEYEVTNIGANSVIWRTANGTIRQFTMADEYGQGGNDYYIRIDGGEPTCTLGASYDADTNSCFPNTESVVPASDFQNAHNLDLSGIASGSHGYSGRIRILKTGYYSRGWIDAHQIYNDVIDTKNDIQQNQSDIANIQTDVQALQEGGANGVLGAYSTSDLPISASPASVALVTDGTTANTPAMGYFYNGKWFRTLDNFLLADKTVDIYIIAGQSNAHGHALVEHLTADQKTQDGIFYSSWHQNTSNASSTQYYSSWATSLIAGYTRGDSNDPSLGVSTMFGPELGFVERANANNLTGGQPIGVLKHAIGASALEDETNVVSHNGANYICIKTHQQNDSNKPHYVSAMPEPNTSTGNTYWSTTSETGESVWSSSAGKYSDSGLSDWDLTDIGDKRGDALRAFKLSVQDGLEKLINAGYNYRLAGVVWWQGESGASTQGLQDLISHMRNWFDAEFTLDMPKEEFPFVITTTTSFWGMHLVEVSNADAYVGVVNTMDWASPESANPLIPEYYYGDLTQNGVSIKVKLDEDFAGYSEVTNVQSAYTGGYQSNNGGTTEGEWKILGTILYFHKPMGMTFNELITASESQIGVTVELLSGNGSNVVVTSTSTNQLVLSGGELTKVDESGGLLLGLRTLVHPGSDETYEARQAEVDAGLASNIGDPVGSQDYKGDGVNDMFTIGQAYADEMLKAKSGNTSSSWTPSEITTRLWIDSADASTLMYDSNGNVSTINDKSGNQTNLDASSTSTITAVPTGLNGLNILSFDNNADATTYENLSLQSNTRHKWFMVMKATGSEQNDGFLTYRSSNPTNEIILFNFSSAGQFRAQWYVNGGSQMMSNQTNLMGTWNILSMELDVPNSQSSAWINGDAINTNVTQNGSNFASIGAGQLSINRYGTMGGSDWAELIFAENISQSDSDKIEGYLAHKWDLTSNLPSTHQYKTTAP